MHKEEILKQHPEISTFEQDKYTLSQSVREYIQKVNQKFAHKYTKLNEFLKWFSDVEKIDVEFVQKFGEQIKDLTYTQDTESRMLQSLQKLVDNYPIPQFLQSKVKPGLYLDLRDVSDNRVFLAKLDEFFDQVKAQSTPVAINHDVSEIGRLPLVEIHDPQLDQKLGRLWTFDITQNPGLSIKDVMAVSMLTDAIEQKTVDKDTIIVEGTSGNTGAGLAIAAAVEGLKTILIIPDKQSQEKANRLVSLGAHTIVTPTKVAAADPKSYYSVRDYLAKKQNTWKASQYDNLANRQAHQKVTGPEIWKQTEGKVTAVVATAGTCGTISGIGKYLKSKNPAIKIIAVDTVGSILYLLKQGYKIEEVEEFAIGYTIQGFGEDIHPQNLDLDVIDRFVRVGDATGLNMTRMLPLLGFVPGQSSGAAYAAILELVDEGYLTSNDNVVTIFADSGIPYRKDVYSDSWMREKKFYAR